MSNIAERLRARQWVDQPESQESAELDRLAAAEIDRLCAALAAERSRLAKTSLLRSRPPLPTCCLTVELPLGKNPNHPGIPDA
jgi:hypothetical protein